MSEQLKGEEATSAPDELEQAVVLIRREPGKRELYLEALAAAGSEGADPISRFDLEGRMAAKPQAATMFQSMGTLIDALVREGLLAEQLPEPEYDPDTEEERVDMARATYALTDKGGKVLERLRPSARLARLFADEPENAEGFRRLLAFCNGTKRTKRQIDDELAAICAAAPRSRHVSAAGIYPSYFTDRLEQMRRPGLGGRLDDHEGRRSFPCGLSIRRANPRRNKGGGFMGQATMTRRSFAKVSALVASGAALGATIDAGNLVAAEAKVTSSGTR